MTVIYTPEKIIKERIKQAEDILQEIPVKNCFITGSFLHKQNYKDIDVFVITRTKKKIEVKKRKVKIAKIDFNDLYSLFYHSVSKNCVSKNILPQRQLKVTLADYWHVINEAVPSVLNKGTKISKEIRSLILYTEYFKTGQVLDTTQLDQKINQFKDHHKILEYVEKEIPLIICKNRKRSYLKRFFYTQAGHYKELISYRAQKFLYDLTHLIARGFVDG